jgi:hypothetical protein
MKMKSTTRNRNKEFNSATILYSQRAYGINHIAENARERLQIEGRINGEVCKLWKEEEKENNFEAET